MEKLSAKPKRSPIGLQSNYFKMEPTTEIAKYRIKTVPEVPMN